MNISEKQIAFSSIITKGMQEDDEKFVIKGVASTPTPDRAFDIVEPLGAKFATPIPLLWQHGHREPVGNVVFAKPDKKGIPFTAEIPKVREAGAVQDRTLEAIHSVQYGLVAGVSIGFNAIDGQFEFLENGGIHFKEWDWLELSLVTVPANPDAKIDAIKAAYQSQIAKELTPSGDPDDKRPGDPGKNPTKRRPIQLIRRRRG